MTHPWPPSGKLESREQTTLPGVLSTNASPYQECSQECFTILKEFFRWDKKLWCQNDRGWSESITAMQRRVTRRSALMMRHLSTWCDLFHFLHLRRRVLDIKAFPSEVFCNCLMLEMYGEMIQCAECEERFHMNCVGLSKIAKIGFVLYANYSFNTFNLPLHTVIYCHLSNFQWHRIVKNRFCLQGPSQISSFKDVCNCKRFQSLARRIQYGLKSTGSVANPCSYYYIKLEGQLCPGIPPPLTFARGCLTRWMCLQL